MPKVRRILSRFVSFENHFANHSNAQNSHHIKGKFQLTAYYYYTDAVIIHVTPQKTRIIKT